jgi:hypothetical protein
VSKHPATRTVLKDDDLEPLVRRTLAGDRVARHDLWVAVDPAIERIGGCFRFMTRLDERKDDGRDMALLVMDRLYADNYRRLGLFHAVLLRREEAALPWLSAVTRHLAVNRMAQHPENVGGRLRALVHIVPLTEELEEQLPESMRMAETIDGKRIQAYVERTLSALELLALRLWCEGNNHKQIAKELGLASEGAAKALLRTVIMRLRRWFRVE